jgi:DNA mismatch repair protein MutS2
MEPKILKTLEYHKILNKLSQHAATALGKKRAEEMQPSSDFAHVVKLLKTTDEAVMIERIKGDVPFGGIRDLHASIHRSRIGGILNAQELLDVATTLFGGRRLKRYLTNVHEEHPVPNIYAICTEITEHKDVEEAIKSCIDDQGEIMDSASAALSRIRHELRTGESRIRDRMEQMIRTPSTQKKLQDNIITIRNDRYVLPVKQEYRADFGGIIHDQSASGATLFMEPEAIVAMNNKIRELKLKEKVEMDKILADLSARVAEIHESLTANMELLTELDYIFAKAGLASELKATLPHMNDRGFIRIKRGRHPLIESGAVVPIDVELGNQYTMIIVTGPNTGGKTVSLKTIGLLNLMAMSGLFIPAEDGSQLCVFDGIYADIGDEQSIEQNLSTFSSHMTNIIRILRDMTPKSLILLDELGAGTDPAEGSALAISILEYIHNIGCRMVATTHYSELKAYAYEKKGIMNASMEFDVQTLSPTYRLLIGIPGRSNAFAISERLGLPKSIIEHGRKQINTEDQKVESMIASLEANRLSAETEQETAKKLRQDVEKLKKQLEDQQTRFKEQREKILLKAEEDARQAVAKARREADEIIADLRKMAMEESASIKEHKLIDAKRKLDLAEPKLRPNVQGTVKKNQQNIQIGDEVFVTRFGQKGHVVEESGEAEVVVQLGIMKMKVDRTEIQRVGTAKKKTLQPVAANVKRSRDEDIRMELDLRGSNLEEAIMEVDRFLDEAFLANLGQVQIIHGKGTGVLRSGIQEYLRKHKLVKNYRLGEFSEGGTGVTVAQLK